MNRVAATSTATSALHDQDITANLTVEVMTDLDTGETMLLTSTQPNQGDLQVVTVAQALTKIAEQEGTLQRQRQLVSEYAAHLVAQFVEQYSIELVELGTAKLANEDPDLASRFCAASAVTDKGAFIVVVPEGQSPIERLAAVRDLVLDMEQRVTA
ncbi:hypothetical protein ACFU6S_03655 [Streptomyces sp. NPDC057456]|uniref:hypothetical protein n=1 Tax=Streptomyces sp. NPDC057456 TaxID=3346139 RepID=UPI00368F7E8F